MSLHSSFKDGGSMKRHRSVLSRLERVKLLEEKKSFDFSTVSVQGLPKVKNIKIKVKKSKEAAAEGEAGAAGAPGAAAGAAGAKGAAAPKAGADAKAGAAKKAGAPGK